MQILILGIIGTFLGQYGAEYFKDIPDYVYAGNAIFHVISGMILHYLIAKFIYKKDL